METTSATITVNQKELGCTGVKVPEIGLGTYLYKGTSDLLRRGLDFGANLIDTAELYENEDVVGRAIVGIRNEVFVATKTHHWRYHEVLKSAEASLKKLGIDTVDLYQIHWPNAAVPIEETMAAMEKLVDQGKVRFIGVSNFTLPELTQAQKALRKHRLASNQMRYSLIDRTIEGDLLDYCQKEQLAIIAYSPLGHSFKNFLAADHKGILSRLSKETGKTAAQLALNWCAAKPGVIAIPKTESMQHLAENCGSSGWRLSAQQTQMLEGAIRFRRRSRLAVAFRRFVRRSIQRVRGR